MSGKGKRILAGLLVAAALIAGGWYALTCPLKFNSRLWKSCDWLRSRMVEDLVEKKPFTDMTQAQVYELMGPGINSSSCLGADL